MVQNSSSFFFSTAAKAELGNQWEGLGYFNYRVRVQAFFPALKVMKTELWALRTSSCQRSQEQGSIWSMLKSISVWIWVCPELRVPFRWFNQKGHHVQGSQKQKEEATPQTYPFWGIVLVWLIPTIETSVHCSSSFKSADPRWVAQRAQTFTRLVCVSGCLRSCSLLW